MNIKKISLSAIGLYAILVPLVFPSNAVAAIGPCYDFNTPPTLGGYIPCLIANVWSFTQTIFIATAVIIFMVTIFKYIQHRSNPKELETYPSKFMYLIVFFLLAAGFGTTLLDIFLKIFKLGDLAEQIKRLNDIMQFWNDRVVAP